MREWNQGVRKRREEKLRAIRGETRKSVSPHQAWGAPVWKKETEADELPWNRPGSWMNTRKKGKWAPRMLLQTFLAFALLTGVYLLYQSEVPASQQAQMWIAEVMERDFNFEGVALWYQEHLGGSAILPVFQRKSDQESDGAKTFEWVAPVAGKVQRPFQEGERGIIIQTKKDAPVVAAAEGWVIQAGTVEGLGNTVVLRHADGRETWYGWLKEIRVEEKDWVKPRQLLGEAGVQENEAMLFFAMKRGDDFVNPADVIPFGS
ncbi:M23 family metallopeptidase [Desmospora activa]|uniref:Stage IV sporulation protein FA n=1 Tax=Desmospora activa DSM 45169 TaxID=1121389 RepID=A0A2T4Z8R8_9BACL|nr:M23 family metallopeptidase [Desmospora activa]PTM58277.1 stage IV sporulation protein FA [Desmospora activa DSM 45169]